MSKRQPPLCERWEDSESIRERLCTQLGLAYWVPDDVLQDVVDETFDVWQANEAEAGLPRYRPEFR